MPLKKSFTKYQFDTKDVAQSVADPVNGFYVTYLAKDGSNNHDLIIKYTDSSTTYTETVATESWVTSQGYGTFDGDYGSLTGVPATFTPSTHTHRADEITSGTFDDARIAESNVMQHVGTNSAAGTKLVGTNTIGLETDLRIGITKVGFTNNYVEFDNTNSKVFFYAGGSKVGELDSSGNLKVTGDITAFATL